MKSFAMYHCSVKLSVRYDGQSESESEHTNLIDEPLVYYMENRFDFCFEHYIWTLDLLQWFDW